MSKTNLKPAELEDLAWQYINECINNKKEHATASGKVVEISDRHLPTISYFLKIWIPLKGKKTICRSTYYNWLNQDNDADKLDTIKRMEGIFEAVAVDIVANEGKGIFYAKNKLGMTDKQQIDATRNVRVMNIDPLSDCE
ncbi:MAG: hypothetical protein IPH24_09755 [Crocinitomicaceae bacterium]|nr:hypothetical protein [Crocinitomicaceae bacterium]